MSLNYILFNDPDLIFLRLVEMSMADQYAVLQ